MSSAWVVFSRFDRDPDRLILKPPQPSDQSPLCWWRAAVGSEFCSHVARGPWVPPPHCLDRSLIAAGMLANNSRPLTLWARMRSPCSPSQLFIISMSQTFLLPCHTPASVCVPARQVSVVSFRHAITERKSPEEITCLFHLSLPLIHDSLSFLTAKER